MKADTISCLIGSVKKQFFFVVSIVVFDVSDSGNVLIGSVAQRARFAVRDV